MADMTEIFQHKKLVKEKLIPFGFKINPDQHFYPIIGRIPPLLSERSKRKWGMNAV